MHTPDCFVPASSFLASFTHQIHFPLGCISGLLDLGSACGFQLCLLSTSSKEPLAPVWASFCLPPSVAGADRKVGGGDSGSTSLPVLFFHIQLPFFATRSISQTKREGGNNYIDNSNTHSSKKDVFFFPLSRMIWIIILILSFTLSLEPWPLRFVALVKISLQW